jgi:hypothetical protein
LTEEVEQGTECGDREFNVRLTQIELIDPMLHYEAFLADFVKLFPREDFRAKIHSYSPSIMVTISRFSLISSNNSPTDFSILIITPFP